MSGDSLPTQADLRRVAQPIRDQGERPTCLAFAVTAIHELDHDQVDIDLSEEALIWGAGKVDPGVERGSTFPAAARALELLGQPEEAEWPYSQPRPKGSFSHEGWRRVELVEVEASLESIQSCLAEGRAVAIGVPVSAGLLLPAKGWISPPASGEVIADYHALTVVGYEDASQRFIVRNSWAGGWADDGYGYLAYGAVDGFILTAWAVRADNTRGAGQGRRE